MHTFFINTSKNVNTSRHEQFFDSLVGKNKILTFDYPLDDLQACADKISELITRNSGISEVYNILVYVETSGRNETALAEETVAALQVEETLLSKLYTLGRKPKESLILFGENFDREAQYARGSTYRENVNKALWAMFPLPTEEKTREVLKKIQKTYAKTIKTNQEEYKTAVQLALAEAADGQKLLQSDNEFVVATLQQMADSIADRNPDGVNLLQELCIAVNTQRKHGQKAMTAGNVRYAYLRLADSDFNVRNRTEYRILLYVYLCAAMEKLELGESCEEIAEDWDECATLSVCSIPDVDWERFSKQLRDKKNDMLCEMDKIQRDEDAFENFDSALLEDTPILSLNVEKPELTVQVKPHRGMSVSQMEKAINDTITEIQNKNSQNESAVHNYITKLTDAFSTSKDVEMSRVKYKSADKKIENTTLTETFVAKELDKADARIAAHKRMTASTTHIDEVLKETETRTQYYFDCLRKGQKVYLFGILFVLLFAIPYGVIQYTLFDVLHGWIFFAVSLGSFILAYTLGYLIFQGIYKAKLASVMGDLCDQFTAMQQTKQSCLDDYERLLKRDIPLSFCLSLYQSELKEYIRKRDAMPEFITYHTRQLSQYIRYITNLLEELDIAHLGAATQENSEYKSVITLEKDKYENTVYSLVDEKTIRDVLIIHEKGDKWL